MHDTHITHMHRLLMDPLCNYSCSCFTYYIRHPQRHSLPYALSPVQGNALSVHPSSRSALLQS